jgi:hypothetical protein
MKLKQKSNVGCKGGTDLMPVSFSDKVPEELKHRIWDDYRTNFYSQKELAAKWNIGISLMGKVVRCMPENIERYEKAKEERERQLKPRKRRA